MITAKEAKIITDDARTLKKARTIQEVINWCLTYEEKIIKSAEKGVTEIVFSLPSRFINNAFSEEDYHLVVKNFFTSFGYTVTFYKDILQLSWE